MLLPLMNERGFLQSLLFLLVGGACMLGGFSASASEPVRVWTSVDGRELKASLVGIDERDVLLRLSSGRKARVPLDLLSDVDRDFVSAREAGENLFSPGELPEESIAPGKIEVTGGPDRYFTPNFTFETEERVSKAFISEASRIYEGTFEGLNAIPHGLTFAPPQGSGHFQGAFLSDARFDAIAREKMASIPGQRVVGLYLGDEQRLLVPYSSLGAERLGSQLTLRKRSDTTTLVHEIVHQVMHRYLPVLPTWFSEGIAEYVSALPYQSGRFEFRNAERGLKKRLEEEYRSKGRRVEDVIRPSDFLSRAIGGAGSPSSLSNQSGRASPVEGNSGTWSGTVSEYRDSLLLVYFFMHLDNPEEAGRPVGAFLHATDRAMQETDSILSEISQFEADRLAYNEEVKRFNESLDKFEGLAKAYNLRVEKYNDQVRGGVPESERIDVGGPPVEPSRPEMLALPERLEDLSKGGRNIDLAGLVEKRALPALIQNRSLSLLDTRMQDQFSEIGIEIVFRP